MWLTDAVRGQEQDKSSRKFVITLNIIEGHTPEVRSCEIIGQGFRNRTSFRNVTRLEDVFVKAVSDGLKECLASLGHGTEVVSFPDLVIETPGLTLAGAHLMVAGQENGTLHILLRFRTFLGSINRAFHSNIGFDDHVHDENSRLAALVVEELAMPILNLCEAAKTGLLEGDATLSTFGENLAARAHEITFQIELVKRFVNQPEPARPCIADHSAEPEPVA